MNTGKSRLLRLQQECREVDEEMVEERARMHRIENKEPVRAVSSFNLFQTPVSIANRMAEMLELRDGMRVLEPSAGLGRLATAARNWASVHLTLVEQSPDCCRELYRELQGDVLVQGDFLACDESRLGGKFDRIIMNPPFKMGTDVKHILHAKSFLAEGGWLLSLCYNGTRQNEKVKPIADHWEVLPEHSFRSEGTDASVALLMIKH